MELTLVFYFFFFSSRRRHTRCSRDWSSDVCSSDLVRVLLAHQPKSAFAARAAGYDLQLSGHTHGGQYFPFNLLVRLFQPFVAGLHRLEAMWLYVSRGTGYWGPPLRLGAAAEITLIQLGGAG